MFSRRFATGARGTLPPLGSFLVVVVLEIAIVTSGARPFSHPLMAITSFGCWRRRSRFWLCLGFALRVSDEASFSTFFTLLNMTLPGLLVQMIPDHFSELGVSLRFATLNMILNV